MLVNSVGRVIVVMGFFVGGEYTYEAVVALKFQIGVKMLVGKIETYEIIFV